MKVTKIISVLLLMFAVNVSCKKEMKQNNEAVKIEQTKCLKFSEYFTKNTSITKRTQLNKEIFSCVFKNKVNLNKYSSCTFETFLDIRGYKCILVKMNCVAGALCFDYYLFSLNKKSEVIDFKLIGKDVAEGEKNLTLDSYSLEGDVIILKSTMEDYIEDDYIEKEVVSEYNVLESGKIELK